ncbi:MAG: proline dehydrogenase family protein [Planctomycetes bacterium]|nr:proline dehydrogenase family protein [Planctomycetota bacterium]
MGVLQTAVALSLPCLPRSLVGRVARRYVAGTTAEDVLALARTLEARGQLATIDLLGENTLDPAEIEAVTAGYLDLLDSIALCGSRAHVSVKLTHIGLRRDEDLARENLRRIVERAEAAGSFARIDMEDSTTTGAALRIFRALREMTPAVGLAIQAYLHRSAEDVESLLPLEPNLRICKGIYREPSQLASHDREEIRERFFGLVKRILAGGGYAAIATHDPWLVDRGLELVEGDPSARGRFEFQMLLGVGERLRPRIAGAGHPLRIYCPYGPEWYDYSLRRLRENPAIAGYIIKDLVRRTLSRGSRRPS